MAGIIEIRDQNERGFLVVELQHLLAFFEKEGPNLIWSIQDIEAVGDPDKLKLDILEIEKRAKQSPQGFILKWEDLLELAQSLTDVWETLIVACSDREVIPKLTYGSEKFGACEIAIEAFDSSFWRVYARDDDIIQKLRTTLKNVRVTQL